METGPALSILQNLSKGQGRGGWESTGQQGGLSIRADLGEMGGGPEVNTHGKKAPSVSPFNEYLAFTFFPSSSLTNSRDLMFPVTIGLHKISRIWLGDALKCSNGPAESDLGGGR